MARAQRLSLGVLVGCPGVLAAQVTGIYSGPDFVVRQKLFVPLDVWTIQDTRGASFDAISPAFIKLESH